MKTLLVLLFVLLAVVVVANKVPASSTVAPGVATPMRIDWDQCCRQGDHWLCCRMYEINQWIHGQGEFPW